MFTPLQTVEEHEDLSANKVPVKGCISAPIMDHKSIVKSFNLLMGIPPMVYSRLVEHSKYWLHNSTCRSVLLAQQLPPLPKFCGESDDKESVIGTFQECR